MHNFVPELINGKLVIPFVGKEETWWSGMELNYQGKKFKMIPTVKEEITVEDIITNTNLNNCIIQKLPYWYWKGQPFKSDITFSKNDFFLQRKEPKVKFNNVSKIYKPIQHKFVLQQAELLRSKFEDKLDYYSAGLLGQGALFWTQLEHKDNYLEVVPNDVIKLTVIYLSSHIGGNAIFTSLQRCVCQNTLSLALSNLNQSIFISHSQNKQDLYNVALNAFEADTMSFKDSIEMFKYWNTLDLKQQEIIDLISFSLGLEEDKEYKDNYKYKAVVELIETQKGAELLKGKYTAYRVFNALTEASQHLRRNKIYNSMFGTVTNFIERFKIKVNNKNI